LKPAQANSSQDPISVTLNLKKGWQSTLSGRAPSQQAWDPEFKLQCRQRHILKVLWRNSQCFPLVAYCLNKVSIKYYLAQTPQNLFAYNNVMITDFFPFFSIIFSCFIEDWCF
jgi:hypothetical protein